MVFTTIHLTLASSFFISDIHFLAKSQGHGGCRSSLQVKQNLFEQEQVTSFIDEYKGLKILLQSNPVQYAKFLEQSTNLLQSKFSNSYVFEYLYNIEKGNL